MFRFYLSFPFIGIVFAIIILDTGYNLNPYKFHTFIDDIHSADSKCWWMLLCLDRKCITVHRRSKMSWRMIRWNYYFVHWNQICFKLRSNIRFWNPIKFQVIEAAIKTTFGQMSDRIMHRYIDWKKREKKKTRVHLIRKSTMACGHFVSLERIIILFGICHGYYEFLALYIVKYLDFIHLSYCATI